ncbi:MAG: ABC transporter ATP-binding protein [Thermoplasmata archaeon]|nr:ABC transporter ATP-binding protein [Thermoplasmata archaeon]
MEPAVIARDLTKVYPKARAGPPALSKVNLSIPAGQVYGLIGRNGAGKTTFVRIAATQLMPTGGSITVLGRDAVADASEVRRRIACVPQESRPLYFLDVDQLVYLYLRLRGMDRSEARRRTDSVLEELGLSAVRKKLVNQLSGGMRRRAMVAMVLASDAEVVYLDEPTTGLDPLARREVWGAIRRASQEHRTVLLTTHYLDEADALSARLALLEGGEVRLEGTPSDLRARIRHPYRVTVEGVLGRSELQSYGEVSDIASGFLVFARESSARDLAIFALGKGARVSMGPVSLEDIFLQVVGRSIEEEASEGAES